MDLHMNGKSVVITGGGTGIGKEVAKAFAREGATVSICGRRLNRLEETQQELLKEGLSIDIYQADVSKVEDIQALADAVSAKHGIDIWVNNAGIDINKPVMDFTPEDFDKMLDTNLRSVYNGSRIAGKIMIDQGRGGVIVNTSSFVVKIPHSNGAIYSATKAGVSSFTRTFAAAFAPYGIRVVGVLPGKLATEIAAESIRLNEQLYVQNIPLRYIPGPEEVAKPYVFIASDACSYMTGVEIELSGGKYAVQDSEEPWRVAGKL